MKRFFSSTVHILLMSVQLPVCYAILYYAMLCDGVDAAVYSGHRCEGKGVAHIASRDDEKRDRNFKKNRSSRNFRDGTKNLLQCTTAIVVK